MSSRPSVSISCSKTTAALAAELRSLLEQENFEVILDSPADEDVISQWGVDKIKSIDSAFDDSINHCILLLTHDYAFDKWYAYRRLRLLDVIFKRRGFVLPVQVGDEEIEVFGLTHLGKIKAYPNEASLISEYFLDKTRQLHDILPESKPVDVERILHIYKEDLLVRRVKSVADRSRRIGYEYIQATDSVTNQIIILFSCLRGPRSNLRLMLFALRIRRCCAADP